MPSVNCVWCLVLLLLKISKISKGNKEGEKLPTLEMHGNHCDY